MIVKMGRTRRRRPEEPPMEGQRRRRRKELWQVVIKVIESPGRQQVNQRTEPGTERQEDQFDRMLEVI